jgi:hypothetical protein
MSGIIDINILLKTMKPYLDNTLYVFVTVKTHTLTQDIVNLNPIATFREEEGMTLVITKDQADKYNYSYDVELQKITLAVHSSLEAVGLTATISSALTKENISANVIAGFYHDHIFVPTSKAALALKCLDKLAQ